MSDVKRVGDLEISQDLEFQKKEWSAERIGWVLMVVIILAGVLGLLGPGPVSNTTLREGPLQVKYFRIDRLLAPSHFEIEVDPQAATDGEIRLLLSQSLLDAVEIKQIVPQPDQVLFNGDRQVYVFPVEEGSQPVKILFHHEPDQVGSHRGSVGLENGPQIVLPFFVLP